ncbi:MAG: carboxy-S-adenosyl-L-methionine synthase CmoA [Pseudomonadales bacterium]|jgi:tRNA (cmo5U34)-methyltransferase|nr:carboxy-S-adenosyl-L-methionine synthase CmoA [Pseudomonadales bacterium]MDP4875458.1 carboxy-S-adenosyl-L-methionine synthase CmoA [Pseudomonadales bacterium]MDP5059280.1 carboxy-S-adenosyl-L-methionine synthase CmoA [Pseudomonadales bacterium]
MTKKDTVYAQPLASIQAFAFDGQVADVFENMINRSVPGYALLLDLIGQLTEKYAQPDSNCYDLGCSLGASTLKIRQHLPASCHVIGVDTSPAMVERCRTNMARDHSQASVEIRQEAMQHTSITNASVVVLNFTLQFIPDEQRADLLAKLARNMLPGGALILSEKIRFEDTDTQAHMTELHHDFKKYHGYSDLEIAQKRAALEHVLIPNTEQQHLQRLTDAGLQAAQVYLRCFNFASFLAIK